MSGTVSELRTPDQYLEDMRKDENVLVKRSVQPDVVENLSTVPLDEFKKTELKTGLDKAKPCQ